jgi:hypothetical protein
MAAAYDEKFDFLFRQLAVNGTVAHVRRYVSAPPQHRQAPAEGMERVAAAPDDAEAGE